MPVVVMEPGRKLGIALLGIEIRAGVDPLTKSGLDKSLSLAVGAGSVRTSEVVMEAELKDSGAEKVGAITMAVMGEQAANGDAKEKRPSCLISRWSRSPGAACS